MKVPKVHRNQGADGVLGKTSLTSPNGVLQICRQAISLGGGVSPPLLVVTPPKDDP